MVSPSNSAAAPSVEGWFQPRGYKHFDVPVGRAFAEQVQQEGFASRHAFSPLIHYTKRERRYRPKLHQVEFKERPIMYASHRDACVLGYYSWVLGNILEREYRRLGISESVIAYRRLGKGNYHFASEALSFATANAPVMILGFDVSSFFDTIDHSLLKGRLKRVLGGAVDDDWYAVFRHVTRYRKVSLESLKAHPTFAARMEGRTREPIATVAELKSAGVAMERNQTACGIPQGTPISSAFANLFMLDFDLAVAQWCLAHDAFYRRYSDDILVICAQDVAADAEAFVTAALERERLTIQAKKTERTLFRGGSNARAQYLGFNIGPSGAHIRASSLSRQWRKLRRSARRTEKAGRDAIAAGHASKIYTRKLRKRFSAVSGGVRNFSAYARRSAGALGSTGITRQVRRIERELEAIIAGFEKSAALPET